MVPAPTLAVTQGRSCHVPGKVTWYRVGEVQGGLHSVGGSGGGEIAWCGRESGGESVQQ